jgi:glycosyltransferase involved in cell wall biosynthesis
MRVLHVLAELKPSGAEMMLAAAGPAFAGRGVESEILSTGSDAGDMAPRLASAGYRVHHLPFGKTPSYFLRVFRLMRSGRYEVIHLHTERANFWFGLVALAARPTRVVRTIHSVFSFHGALRRRRGFQRRVLGRLGVTHVACSRSVQMNERARFGLETRYVPNWYDSGRFYTRSELERSEARQSLGISEAESVIVTAGNCADVKNHAALITALARIRHTGRVVYLHAGSEEPGYPERVLARTLGIEDKIRFLGLVDDVPGIFAASDLFAMPSLYEGFSVALLEALACGLPALLTEVPGLVDFRELDSGLVYAEPTAESLARSLESLLARSRLELRSESFASEETVKSSFGLEAGVERYVQLYRGV